jgi:hydroxyacylglutathione hydrolase
MRLHTAAVALVFALAAAAAAAQEVVTIPLQWSNVHLIKGPQPVLVDAGGKADVAALSKGLAEHGVRLADIAWVVLTHGHSDHAGAVAGIRRESKARIVIGRGDAPMAAAGHNDDLQPTNLMARALKAFAIDPAYEPFRADVELDAPLDLAPWGLRGRIVPMPGHTPGSLVLLLDDGRAFVGDMMLGGWFGGALFASKAGEHYFQGDLQANHANIRTLLGLPVKTFYLGHGGPVDRASVVAGFGFAGAAGTPEAPR